VTIAAAGDRRPSWLPSWWKRLARAGVFADADRWSDAGVTGLQDPRRARDAARVVLRLAVATPIAPSIKARRCTARHRRAARRDRLAGGRPKAQEVHLLAGAPGAKRSSTCW
jgi:hypothetical protein